MIGLFVLYKINPTILICSMAEFLMPSDAEFTATEEYNKTPEPAVSQSWCFYFALGFFCLCFGSGAVPNR
jgi:hypothetical protein